MGKHRGCSIIFINNDGRVLLFLRDDKPGLPYPGMWDIPGGHVEAGETPAACIAREMKEEMDLDLKDVQLFRAYEFDDRTEYVFWKQEPLDISRILLTEGQYLKWFSREAAKRTRLAYGFNQVIEDFFKSR